MGNPNTNHGDDKLDASHTAHSDTGQSIISKIAGALGVDESDGAAITQAFVKARAELEARQAAENQAIFDDALKYGRRTETGPVKTPGGTEIIHNKIFEVVPGASGRLEDISGRTATQITNPDGSIYQDTQYHLPGHIAPDADVGSVLKKEGDHWVETVTRVTDPDGLTGIKVGDTRIVPAPDRTHAGLLPSTIDPPSGKFGTTVHPDNSDPVHSPSIGNHDLIGSGDIGIGRGPSGIDDCGTKYPSNSPSSDSSHTGGSGSNTPSSGSSNTGGTGSNSGDDPHHAAMPFTPSGSNKGGDGSNSASPDSGSSDHPQDGKTSDTNAGSNSPNSRRSAR